LKVLLDACISPRTRAALAKAGHDVVWVGDWGSDPGDQAILESAQREGRVLVTLDKDFGELAVAFDQPHSGIVRLVDIAAERQASYCEEALARYGKDLAAGAIVTVTRERTRLRPPDDPEWLSQEE
jgi:predicted nuclease of predicted toxin-antitoxin system